MLPVQAKHCIECNLAFTVHRQDLWSIRILKALHIRPSVAVFISWLIVVALVFTSLLKSPSFSSASGAPDKAAVVVGLVFVSSILGTLWWLVVGEILHLPSLIRRFIIGWSWTKTMKNGEIHTHLGHQAEPNEFAYFGRHYGFWRRTRFHELGNYDCSERNGRITIRANSYKKKYFELTLPRDTMMAMVSVNHNPGTFPAMVVTASEAYSLCREIAKIVSEQHRAIGEDNNALGKSPHGQAMRQFLRDLLESAYRLSHPHQMAWPGSQHSPFDEAVAVARRIDQQLLLRAKRGKESKASARPQPAPSSTR